MSHSPVFRITFCSVIGAGCCSAVGGACNEADLVPAAATCGCKLTVVNIVLISVFAPTCLLFYLETHSFHTHIPFVRTHSFFGLHFLHPQVRTFHHIMGGVMDPHAAYLLLRGIKTLELRVARHNSSAHTIARRLEAHKKVRVGWRG